MSEIHTSKQRNNVAVTVLVAVLGSGGCRSGGPEANGLATDGGAVLSRGEPSVDGQVGGADSNVIPGSDGGAGGVEAGSLPTENGCVPPVQSDVCDPVCNTGCEGLSRCDVTDLPRSGKCIGAWVSGEGELCVKTPLTDPCAARLTCVDGACRRLCYRDADCAAPGSCCGQELFLQGQPSGYKICVACPP